MASVWSRFKRLLTGTDGRAGAERSDDNHASARPAKTRWIVLESYNSMALGEMYLNLLHSARIPVSIQQWGGGSAVVGGAPMGLRLLVPEERLEDARAVVGQDQAGEGETV